MLGAGMVGLCTAWHLQSRGHAVTLVDRRAPGLETSFGNAGLIQREAVEPYAMPLQWRAIVDAILGRGTVARTHWRALPALWPELLRYALHSRPAAHARAAAAFSRLIEHCQTEHAALMARAGAHDLVHPGGFRMVFRHAQAFDAAAQDAQRMSHQWGVQHALLDARQLAAQEPALADAVAARRLHGAVRWLQPWAVRDPGDLLARYALQFEREGGRLVVGDAQTLASARAGWQVQTASGRCEAAQVVIALGPWSDALVRRLGYRMGQFVKRGYHRHYRSGHASPTLRQAFLDAERGYVVAPMREGLRITTGAEFARLDAPPTPVQLQRAEGMARELLALGEPGPEPVWLGARPCTVDMLPVMGPAPRHAGLWFNFGHAHQGFTLGAVAGRLLAEMIDGTAPLVDPQPYAPGRFA